MVNGSADAPISITPDLLRKIKQVLKYGISYSQSNPIEPPTTCPADLANDPAFNQSREISHYINAGNLTLQSVLDALGRDTFAIPGSANREGYAIGRDLAYWLSGYAEYRLIEEIAQTHGVSKGRYFDFGGSTGRVFRNFVVQSSTWDVWTSDFKKTSFDFNNQFFDQRVRCFLNTAYASLPIEDSYFDLVSACSVFTHIDEAESLWLLELRRIMRVGGIAYITILNEQSWTNDQAVRKTAAKFRPDLKLDEPLAEDKTVIAFRDDDPYNCNVLHHSRYIRKNWGRYFEICEIRSPTLHPQAVVVCRKVS